MAGVHLSMTDAAFQTVMGAFGHKAFVGFSDWSARDLGRLAAILESGTKGDWARAVFLRKPMPAHETRALGDLLVAVGRENGTLLEADPTHLLQFVRSIPPDDKSVNTEVTIERVPLDVRLIDVPTSRQEVRAAISRLR